MTSPCATSQVRQRRRHQIPLRHPRSCRTRAILLRLIFATCIPLILLARALVPKPFVIATAAAARLRVTFRGAAWIGYVRSSFRNLSAISTTVFQSAKTWK